MGGGQGKKKEFYSEAGKKRAAGFASFKKLGGRSPLVPGHSSTFGKKQDDEKVDEWGTCRTTGNGGGRTLVSLKT